MTPQGSDSRRGSDGGVGHFGDWRLRGVKKETTVNHFRTRVSREIFFNDGGGGASEEISSQMGGKELDTRDLPWRCANQARVALGAVDGFVEQREVNACVPACLGLHCVLTLTRLGHDPCDVTYRG